MGPICGELVVEDTQKSPRTFKPLNTLGEWRPVKELHDSQKSLGFSALEISEEWKIARKGTGDIREGNDPK